MEYATEYYPHLLNNARKAKKTATDPGFRKFWEGVEEQLMERMSHLGILKNSKQVH